MKDLARTVPALLGLVLAGPGAELPRPARPPVAIGIKTFQYAPDSIQVAPGTVVEWVNRDAIEHTVTAGSPEAASLQFDGKLTGPNGTFGHLFQRPGSYRYFCARHEFMRGVVHVTQPQGE